MGDRDRLGLIIRCCLRCCHGCVDRRDEEEEQGVGQRVSDFREAELRQE